MVTRGMRPDGPAAAALEPRNRLRHLCLARATQVPNWSDEDDAKLQGAVRLRGPTWRAIAEEGTLPGRTAEALRLRWRRVGKRARTVRAAARPRQTPPEQLAAGRAKPGCDAVAGAEAEARRRGATATWLRPRAGGTMRRLLFDSGWRHSAWARRQARWSDAVHLHARPARRAQAWELRLVKGWNLRAAGGQALRATFLAREAKVRHRRALDSGGGGGGGSSDARPVGISKRGRLATLLAARVQVPWLDGPALPRGRHAVAREGARWMGVRFDAPAWRAAERLLSEEQQWEAATVSVDARMADASWSNAEEMLAEAGCSLEGPLRYASMFSGALDAFLAALRRRVSAAECVAVAEKDEARRRCVGEAYCVPLERRYRTAWRLARQLEGGVDVLTATPDCSLLSTAPHTAQWRRKARAQRAARQLRSDVAAVGEAARRSGAKVIMMEQTSGLATHHRKLYAEVQRTLQRWPFTWRHAMVDAAALGAPHHRKRLLWVGVRVEA